MKSGLKIMDSDMHLREPADLWDKYMGPEFRDQAPKILSSTARSSAMVLLEGKSFKAIKPTYRGGIFDATRIDEEIADAARKEIRQCRAACRRWIAKDWMSPRSIRPSARDHDARRYGS